MMEDISMKALDSSLNKSISGSSRILSIIIIDEESRGHIDGEAGVE